MPQSTGGIDFSHNRSKSSASYKLQEARSLIPRFSGTCGKIWQFMCKVHAGYVRTQEGVGARKRKVPIALELVLSRRSDTVGYGQHASLRE
jgi:hypothetical protein